MYTSSQSDRPEQSGDTHLGKMSFGRQYRLVIEPIPAPNCRIFSANTLRLNVNSWKLNQELRNSTFHAFYWITTTLDSHTIEYKQTRPNCTPLTSYLGATLDALTTWTRVNTVVSSASSLHQSNLVNEAGWCGEWSAVNQGKLRGCGCGGCGGRGGCGVSMSHLSSRRLRAFAQRNPLWAEFTVTSNFSVGYTLLARLPHVLCSFYCDISSID